MERIRGNRWLILLAGLIAVAVGTSLPGSAANAAGGLRFRITQPSSLSTDTSPGRMFILVSTHGATEPRFQTDVVGGIPFWGRDVSSFGPGDVMVFDDSPGTIGYPLDRFTQLPEGDYYVEAFFERYTVFHRSDGFTLELPMPCGDGRAPLQTPYSLKSEVTQIHLAPGTDQVVDLSLSNEVQPPEPVPAGGTCQQGNPPDTRYVKHVKIQSDLLTNFWGQPMYIGANVLLPQGYDLPRNRNVRYPTLFLEGHFPVEGHAPFYFQAEGGNPFTRYWLSGQAPKMIIVELRHETPYYDDSYGVNSANHGPYGDAINHELLPELDARFRTIGHRWGRALFGGSTGGWETIATQLLYPNLYEGAIALCPDSPDFHALQLIDIYGDDNAYYRTYNWDRSPRGDARKVSGEIIFTMDQENHWELALGTKGRSGGVWDGAWQATYSPVGADGYPAPIWDKQTGEIDPAVAKQWRTYDLNQYVSTYWSQIGPLVAGQISVYVGDDDTYYLTSAPSCSRR